MIKFNLSPEPTIGVEIELQLQTTITCPKCNHQTTEHTTYVAEQNLDLEEHLKSIQHPLINSLFTKFDGSQYHLKSRAN